MVSVSHNGFLLLGHSVVSEIPAPFSIRLCRILGSSMFNMLPLYPCSFRRHKNFWKQQEVEKMPLCNNGSCFRYSDLLGRAFKCDAYNKTAWQFAVNSTSKLQPLISLVLIITSDWFVSFIFSLNSMLQLPESKK